MNPPHPDKYQSAQLVAFLQQLLTHEGYYDDEGYLPGDTAAAASAGGERGAVSGCIGGGCTGTRSTAGTGSVDQRRHG